MKRYHFLLINIIIINILLNDAFSQGYKDLVVSDGPYIFNKDGRFIAWVIKNNHLKIDSLVKDNFDNYKSQFDLIFDYGYLNEFNLEKPDYRQAYRKVDSIAVLSDIHGDYKAYINLLKAMGVIDKNLNWNFGKGHLVIAGDIFDRGDKVTEVLWHLFGLEKQALVAGGKVHILLGNHELMVIDRDLRYLNDKYRKVEEVTDSCYSSLFSGNSLLGIWLRSKPVVISINDNLFMHAGISMDLVMRYLSPARINQIISGLLAGKVPRTEDEAEVLYLLIENSGPFWYRGYFTDKNFTEERLDSILVFFGKKHIVVGHTPLEKIDSYYNGKLYGVDSGIGNGEPGEILIIKDNIYFRGNSSGKRIKIQAGR